MNDFFYYFGFLYIGFLLKLLWDTFQPSEKEDIVNFSGSDIHELMHTNEKGFKELVSTHSILQTIVGMIFFIWCIVGYLADTEEKGLFLFDILYTIFNWAFFIASGMILGMRALSGDDPKILNKQKRKLSNILGQRTSSIIELIIISLILYSHFF